MRTLSGKISTPTILAAALALGAVPTIAMSAGSSTGSYTNSYATDSAGDSMKSYTAPAAGYTAAPASAETYTAAPATGGAYTATPAPAAQPYLLPPVTTGTVDAYTVAPVTTTTTVDSYSAAPTMDTGAAPSGNYVSIGAYVDPGQ